MYDFTRTTNAFNFVFDKNLSAGETLIVKMPAVSANKRGINDIGWQTNGDVTLYGTLCAGPTKPDTIWTQIENNSDLNKTMTAIKVQNSSTPCRLVIRVILN